MTRQQSTLAADSRAGADQTIDHMGDGGVGICGRQKASLHFNLICVRRQREAATRVAVAELRRLMA
jgi:hypothetical protein